MCIASLYFTYLLFIFIKLKNVTRIDLCHRTQNFKVHHLQHYAKLKSCYRVWIRHLLTGSQVVAHITKLDFYELVSLFKIRFGSS